MVTECPHCGYIQKPNCDMGDIDICDDCGERYEQFVHEVEP